MQSSIEKQSDRIVSPKIIQSLCVSVVCVVLVAGLWPFQAPRNNVTWLGKQNGLRFGRYGTAVSSNSFRPVESGNERSCSMEIWLVPGPSHKGTILAFVGADDARLSFALRQVGENLAIERYVVDQQGNITRPWLTIERAFRSGPIFVTVTSGSHGTLVYIDGVVAKTSASFGLEREDFAGRLVLATSSINDSWTGLIFGLALYSQELEREQVSRSFHSWTSATALGPAKAEAEPALALYLFNERDGAVVHNERNPETNLIIPARYLVLHNPFLQPPWEHYRNRWSAAHYWPYWQDAGVNVAGFMPVGFCFAAYFVSVKRRQHPLRLCVLVGFTLSLTIEVLQAFLPTRNSGMTDLITNTVGTALGGMLYRCSLVQYLWNAALSPASSSRD